MKKISNFKTFLPLIIISLSLINVATIKIAVAQEAKDLPELSISLRSVLLRKTPEALGTKVMELSYGDKVRKLEDSGSWIKVKTAKSFTGYIPVSATIAQNNSTSNSILSYMAPTKRESDITLAGKGFNQEAESRLKQKTGASGYKSLASIDKNRVSDKDLKNFIMQGKLF